jgi:hypothetical protein
VTVPGEIEAAVAASGLPTTLALPDEPLDAAVFAGLLRWARQERLLGLLARAVAEGRLEVTPQQYAVVREDHVEAMAAVLALERALLGIAERLERSGVPYIVLKGPSDAYTVYPDASLRCYGDIDLLVPAADVDRAVELFVADGCRRHYPELRHGFDRRFGKSVTLVRPDGIEVDLHRTFVAGRFGLTIPLGDLFMTSTRVCIGGRDIPILAHEERMLAACYNAAVGDREPRTMTLRDIAQHLVHPELDHERVMRLAEAWRGRAVVARAVLLTWNELRLVGRTPIVDWSATYRPSRHERQAVAGYTISRSATAQTLSAFRALPGVRNKAQYLHAVLVPNRAYLERGGADPRRYVHWWQRGVRSLTRAVRGHG